MTFNYNIAICYEQESREYLGYLPDFDAEVKGVDQADVMQCARLFITNILNEVRVVSQPMSSSQATQLSCRHFDVKDWVMYQLLVTVEIV